MLFFASQYQMYEGVRYLPVSDNLKQQCYSLFYSYLAITIFTLTVLEIQLQRLYTLEMQKGWVFFMLVLLFNPGILRWTHKRPKRGVRRRRYDAIIG